MSILLPSACLACGEPVDRSTTLLCGECDWQMPWLLEPCCGRCGLPLPCGIGGRCPAARQAFVSAWAAARHAGPARLLVVSLKYRSALAVADLMGREIALRIPPQLVAGSVVVPVPSDPWRRRRRGFDHAALIAAAAARHVGMPIDTVLRRNGPAPRQSGQQRRVRTIAGRISVEVTGPPPSCCLLVDDVHTTGATLDACARALLRAGAAEIRAVSFARALPGAAAGKAVTSNVRGRS